MSDDEWVKAAMTDDSMVVKLLIRLHHATPPKRDSPALPLDWSVRQRRSKPMLHAKKPTARASPTTPLSWSGATSHSGGAVDGSEESSRTPAKRSDATRSKVTAASEGTTTKRSRKKKTLAELKEDEMLLLKERRHLKRELATLRVTLEKQRATNESLKRLKIDLQSQPVKERGTTVASEEAATDQTQENVVASGPIPSMLPPTVTGDHLDASGEPFPLKGLLEVQKEVPKQETAFMLPDLNLPLEGHPSSEVSQVIS
ncbi:hypothetical protein F0562_023114 [Nyssa sinensis]|uniref:Uncharacterized protein n=1 Tax=Nyssa sinensis TaxID=561372 RepID=A0A5J5BJT0_9ASTE|nr:hypothetical protein F0562_023114 [Nyssa sinensis]